MNILPIKDFNGYFISDTGQVFCNKGKGARSNSKPKDLYEVMPRVARNGYTRVYMRNSITNKRVDKYIHRLVATAFIPNPNNKPCVNHKDCNRSNNSSDNLEWVTHAENNSQSIKLGHLYRDPASGKFVGNYKY